MSSEINYRRISGKCLFFFICLIFLITFIYRAIKSGGNKRKLSSAIAFIGQPKTVILDEVSLKFFLLFFS